MKNSSKLNIISILLSILFTFFFVVYFVYSTTIGEDISTTNLTITNNLSVGNNATTTGKLNNVIIVDGIHFEKTSAGIQNAINALPEEGGKVFLPEGTYQVSSTILIPSNVTLEGAHPSSTILYLVDNSHCNVIQNQDTTNGNTNITLRNFKIDGNDAGNDCDSGNGCYAAIYFSKVSHSTIENLWIYDFEDDGIRFDYGDGDNIISNSRFESNGSRGAVSIREHSNRNIVSNNVFVNNSGRGVYFYYCESNTIIGNSFQDNSGEPVDIVGGGFNVVTGNAFYSDTYGIRLWESFYNIISNNTLYDVGPSGSGGSIWLYVYGDGNTSHNLITSNQIYHSNGYAGINIDNSNCQNNYLSNNYISGIWNAGEIRDLGTNTIYANQLLNNNLLFTFPTSTSKFIIGATSSSEKFLLQIEPNVDITLGQGSSSTSTTFITLRDSNSALWYLYPDTSGNLVVTTTKP